MNSGFCHISVFFDKVLPLSSHTFVWDFRQGRPNWNHWQCKRFLDIFIVLREANYAIFLPSRFGFPLLCQLRRLSLREEYGPHTLYQWTNANMPAIGRILGWDLIWYVRLLTSFNQHTRRSLDLVGNGESVSQHWLLLTFLADIRVVFLEPSLLPADRLKAHF